MAVKPCSKEPRLRADAARNAASILNAAREVFAELGANAQLDEIARRAGVSAATLYRHFPNKEVLISAIIEDGFGVSVEPALEAALMDEDPWRGMLSVFEAALSTAARDAAAITASRNSLRVTANMSARYFSALRQIVSHAQSEDSVRADLEPGDLQPLLTMLLSIVWIDPAPDGAWRRYLALLFDALRPGGATSLPGSAPLTWPQNWGVNDSSVRRRETLRPEGDGASAVVGQVDDDRSPEASPAKYART